MHDYKWHKVSEMLPDKCGIYDVKIKNCYDEIVEVKALYTYTVNEGFTFCR